MPSPNVIGNAYRRLIFPRNAFLTNLELGKFPGGVLFDNKLSSGGRVHVCENSTTN